MRIVEIVPQLASGGGERFVVDLCNELAQMGHEVMLIVLHRLDNPILSFYLPEVDSRVTVKSMNKRKGADLTLPWRITKELKAFNPDVVHTHLSGIVYTFISTVTQRNPKYFHTVHNVANREAGNKITATIRKWAFIRKKFTPVTISEESQRSFREFYGIDAPMIFNGRNVLANLKPSATVLNEINSLKSSSDDRVIVNLARIMTQKRQDLIARVCKRLENEGYNFTLLMIGRKGDQEIVDKIERTMCSNVHMLGERSNPLEYLAAADGYCLMSSYEGMPISLIEALGCGAVPICTPVGGIVNVINDGENGFLATDISEDACYIALKRFLDTTPEQLSRLKLAAKISYQPFSMTECTNKYIALFNTPI